MISIVNKEDIPLLDLYRMGFTRAAMAALLAREVTKEQIEQELARLSTPEREYIKLERETVIRVYGYVREDKGILRDNTGIVGICKG